MTKDKEFEAKVVIICILIGALLLGISLVFRKDIEKDNNILINNIVKTKEGVTND